MNHNKIVKLTKEWLIKEGYEGTERVIFNHLVVPDLTLKNIADETCIYEVKPPYNGDIRMGIMQAIGGLLFGYKSYLVVYEGFLPKVSIFLPFVPKIGVITYSLNYDFTINQEPELLNNELKELATNLISESLKNDTKIWATKSRYNVRHNGKTVAYIGRSQRRNKVNKLEEVSNG